MLAGPGRGSRGRARAQTCGDAARGRAEAGGRGRDEEAAARAVSPWQAAIDEGWTRWILEEYGFAPVTLRNGDVQAGHLRERFDAILLADSSTRSIMDGFAPGTIPGEYAGGIGEAGAEALRDVRARRRHADRVQQCDAVCDRAVSFAGDERAGESDAGPVLLFRLAVAGGNARHGASRVGGDAARPDRDVRARSGVRYARRVPRQCAGELSARRNPLASGYLLHRERIQGKAAALEVFYGDGRIYLLGFRPQWRGQSHGTYKLFFNAIYDSPASAKPTAPARAAGAAAAADPVRRWSARVRDGSGGADRAESGVLRGAGPGRGG